MQSSRSPHKWRDAIFFLTGLLIVITDQLSKEWIRANIDINSGQTLLEAGFFRIIHTQNTGAAFGLFQNYSSIIAAAACVAVIIIILCALFAHRYFPVIDNLQGKAALGLVLGGTMGNLVDRFRQGYVTDFIDFNFWPTFNVADSAVTIGVIILAFSLLRSVLAERQ